MRRSISTALWMFLLAVMLPAQAASDTAELTKLLNEFLAGASSDDAAIHNKFWAEDLIYTGSGGSRRGKAEIMKDVRSSPPPKADAPKTVFSAEDVRIQQYGTTAIVAFRLVGTTTEDGVTAIAKFYNTGTFLKRKGKWQVVSWQATRIPASAAEAKKDVSEAEAGFWKAVLAGDTKMLKRLTDDSFIWVHHTGEQNIAKQFIDDVATGKLKYSNLTTDKVTVTVTSDTAVVRGTSNRQRAAVKDANGALKEQVPFTTFYTLVFVNRGGAWKALSLHTSRVV